MSVQIQPAALAPKAAAHYCGISLPTFWRLQKGDTSFPKAFPVSARRVAVMRADLDKWLSGKQEATR